MEPNRPTRTIRRLTDLSGRSQNPNTATTEDGEDGGTADEAAPAAEVPAITQATPDAHAEEKPAAEKKPRREFGLGTAQSLASVPAMVLEDDLASQLVVEESEVFDDPFYEALVATEEEWPEPEAEPEPETEADTESEPKPADAKAADETPDEAAESIDDSEELPNTTASGLLADGEQSEPAAASAEAAPSSDDAAVEAPAEMTPESVETLEHEPEPEPEPKSEPEPEPSKPAEETASSAEIVATKKPEAKPHGFRAWLHRLFHHS